MNSSTSTSKRHKGSPSPQNNGIGIGIGSDRLSELPDSILVHILSFLPILDAVRTVAIRRFGSLWTWLPSLKFHGSEFRPNWDEDDIDDELLTTRVANLVSNVLFLHKRVPIQSFHLRFSGETDIILNDPVNNKSFGQESNAWICSVIDRQVEDLFVDISVLTASRSVLPQCVLTSQFLAVLNLHNYRINEQCPVWMKCLMKLSLCNIEASNEVLNKVISGSPCLQELTLWDIIGLDEIRFIAPNIRELRLSFYNGLIDCPNLKILRASSTQTPMQVVDVSSIREVSIGDCYDNFNAFSEYLVKFANAEFFRYISKRTLYSEQNFPQARWKCLKVESKLCDHIELLGICTLLTSSPLLEELEVYTYSQHWGSKCDQLVSSLELPSCSMQHLKFVTIGGYKIPCHALLRLAEFLLASCVTLEKLVILPSKYECQMVHEPKFLKQLLSFPRASTKARVIFA